MAPANASAPPATHTARNSHGCGTAAATCGGVKRMPPPMTFDTITAAASSGPRRRSSTGVAVWVVVTGDLRDKMQGRTRLAREQLSRHLDGADVDPLGGAVLDVEAGVDVAELRVLQEVEA